MHACSPPIFLRAFLVTLSVCLLVSGALIVGTSALGRPSLPYEKIYEYQIAKLETRNASQLFIGDSSLGNSVDAGLWSSLSGEPTLNLALTGAFGYEGSYWMLRRALSAGMRPKIVYLMQTPDMMTRSPVEDDLLAEISEAKGPAALAAWWRKRMNLQELDSAFSYVLRSVRARKKTRQDYNIVDDYMQQGGRIAPGEIDPSIDVDAILPEKSEYLKKFAGLCRSNRIECLYIHGPIAEKTCENSAAYFTSVEDIVEKAGLPLLSRQPMCIPMSDLGDAVDHVAPSRKDAFTSALFDLVKKSHLVPDLKGAGYGGNRG